MNLFAIVLALLIEHVWSHTQKWQARGSFQRYITVMRRFWGDGEFYDGPTGVFFVLIPIVLVTLFFQQILSYGFLAVLGLFFSVVVLLFTISSGRLRQQIKRYIESMSSNDEERACDLAADMLNKAVPIDEGERDKKLIHLLLAKANDKLIGVLFWFAVLGPVGAVIFRMAVEIKERCELEKEEGGYSSAAWVLYGVLGWLPAKLTSFIFSVLGSYSNATTLGQAARLQGAGEWINNNQRVLIATGMGSLKLDNESTVFNNHDVKRVVDLLRNTVIVILFLVALFMTVFW